MAVDVARLIREAGEAAKLVPEHLQEAAFNRAYETLLAAEQVAAPANRKRTRTGSRTGRTDEEVAPDGKRSLDELDRTAHPEINHSGTALDNALRLLRAAKDDLDLDGLSATEVARVLIDKFRCKLTRRGVSKALNDAGQYVNRHKDGSVVVFRIMGPGEDYLDGLGAGGGGRVTTKRRRGGRKKAAANGEAPKQQGAAAPRKKPGSGKVGPATAMTKLLEGGYFSSPRTIGEIIDKLKHDRGRTFKQNELSPVLVRWLRSDKLSRAQNAEGQYEYTAA